MSSRVFCLAIDCRDVAVLTDFWCAALDYAVVKRWTDARGTEYVALGRGDEPVVLLQPVPEAKTGKNRLHLDLAARAGSQESEVERLVGLGAAVVSAEADFHWVVMTDPEGNEFCVLPPRP